MIDKNVVSTAAGGRQEPTRSLNLKVHLSVKFNTHVLVHRLLLTIVTKTLLEYVYNTCLCARPYCDRHHSDLGRILGILWTSSDSILFSSMSPAPAPPPNVRGKDILSLAALI